jgi:hypothetical protein
MPTSISCSRRSGAVSIRIARPCVSTSSEQRRRRLRGSVGSQRPQSGPIAGTPQEAPQPRTVTFMPRDFQTPAGLAAF